MLAFGITAGFMIIETIGGVISGSLALLADAGHILTDSAALLLLYLQCSLQDVHQITAIPLGGCA